MPIEQDDRSYYEQRFAQCVELAAQATTSSARIVHQELARLYADKLKALGVDPSAPSDGGETRMRSPESD